ncbi:hypothetical protein ABMA27_007568 [Loxostege sticticalis]|uniref:Sodium channel protein Nach n=1 Tax=Loxostege sticticalis TaxID=481309 RepID=A0ABR3HFX6_LOXSC
MHAVKEVWWQKYRRRQYKRQRLSLEMILRRSAWETSREYVSQCSIAGVKQICDPDIGIIQRLIWIVLFVALIASLINVLCHTWMQAISSPLIVTMESSTHPISEIDFPAVALCNINRISQKALTAFANEIYEHLPSGGRHYRFSFGHKNKNDTVNYIKDYMLQLGNMFDYWWDENVKVDEHLDEIFSPANDTRQLIDLMRQLAPSCEDMLVKCAWAFQIVDCKDLFQVRRTSRGHCCAFNYILDYGSADRPNGTIATVRKQTIAGYLEGLNVILDPMVDDYAYPVSPNRGFEIFLFDPTHFADPNAGGRVIRRIIEPNARVLLELQSVEQLATQEVRKYPARTRKCLFHDENTKKFGNLYSYSACIVSCKIKTINTLCKCTPFFLPTSSPDSSICTLNELRCLNKYKEKLLYIYPTDALRTDGLEVELQDSLWCPQCRPDCEFTQHFTRAFKGPITMRNDTEKELRLEFRFVSRRK